MSNEWHQVTQRVPAKQTQYLIKHFFLVLSFYKHFNFDNKIDILISIYPINIRRCTDGWMDHTYTAIGEWYGFGNNINGIGCDMCFILSESKLLPWFLIIVRLKEWQWKQCRNERSHCERKTNCISRLENRLLARFCSQNRHCDGIASVNV